MAPPRPPRPSPLPSAPSPSPTPPLRSLPAASPPKRRGDLPPPSHVLFPHRTHCHRCRLPASGTGAGQHRVGLRSQPRQSKFHRLNQKQPTSRDGPARPSSSHRQHLLHSIVPRRVNLPRRSARGLRSSIPPAYQQRRATSNWVLCSWHHYTLVRESSFDLPNCN